MSKIYKLLPTSLKRWLPSLIAWSALLSRYQPLSVSSVCPNALFTTRGSLLFRTTKFIYSRSLKRITNRLKVLVHYHQYLWLGVFKYTYFNLQYVKHKFINFAIGWETTFMNCQSHDCFHYEHRLIPPKCYLP